MREVGLIVYLAGCFLVLDGLVVAALGMAGVWARWGESVDSWMMELVADVRDIAIGLLIVGAVLWLAA